MLKPVGIAAIAALTTVGCTVGPDHVTPIPDLPATFSGADAPAFDGEQAVGEGLWVSLGLETLERLIVRAQLQNTTVAQAVATLNETRALSGLQVYSLFPTATINVESERNQQSPADPFSFPGPTVTERFRAGFDVSWEIDLFGNLRRQSEQIRRQVEADTAALAAVRLSVTAEVAQAYFGWLGNARRVAILNRNLANQQENVRILEASLDAGRGTALDVSRARSIERSVAALLPQAEADVARSEQRLAVLTRWSIDELRTELGTATSMPTLPRMVAVGTPEDWLRRRPDIQAAERRLAASTSAIGVEVVQYFPIVTLLGDFGWNGRSEAVIGDSDAERWRVAPSLSWRILDAGRIRQRVKAAEARADGALAAYNESWLLALEETENAMNTYRATTLREAALSSAVSESQNAARLARLRFDAGADTYLAVLDAERSAIEFEDQLATARTDRATALAALYKSLGGDFAVGLNN
ncbi:MAG: efflux transporter outer membrane subunit [Pseudomonadota bacterium]